MEEWCEEWLLETSGDLEV